MINDASLDLYVATNAVDTVACALGAPDALTLLEAVRGDDEALDTLYSWISSWSNDVAAYAADGRAEDAARSAGWVAAGWAAYRAELLRAA